MKSMSGEAFEAACARIDALQAKIEERIEDLGIEIEDWREGLADAERRLALAQKELEDVGDELIREEDD